MTKEYESLKTAIMNVTHPFEGRDSEVPQPDEHALRQDELMLLKKLMVTYEDNDFIDYLNSLSPIHERLY